MNPSHPHDEERPARKPRPAQPRLAKPQPAKSPAAKPLPVRKPAPVARQQATAEEEAQAGEEGTGFDFGALIQGMPSWMLSMVVHMVILVVLALIFVPSPPSQSPPSMELAKAEEPPEKLQDQPIDLKDPITPELALVDTQEDTPPPPEEPPLGPDTTSLDTGLMEPEPVETSSTDLAPSMVVPLGPRVPGGSNDPYGRRFQAGAGTGGDRAPGKDTEDAIDRALEWLAAHQMEDGGWSFDHNHGACQGRCGQPGTYTDARIGATGLALLAFLGRGNTHQEGDYQPQVRAGLAFLINRMQPGPVAGTGSLHEARGNMYSHGLATIALAEAYGMTNDRWVGYPAQHAVNFVQYAQDPVGGGWRYDVRQAGDTSVVGWQLMALKSAQMAGLQVNANAYQGAIKFLDAVQSESGARYGYDSPGQGRATTAIGLLSRMYLGWRRDHGALQRGGEWLAEKGPLESNLYYNYYASQVLLHLDDPDDDNDHRFDDWDDQMRPWLVGTQEMEGHLRGSWYFNNDLGSNPGGRLYCTAMATLMLEVYYRTSLIYQQDTLELDFPL